MCKPGWMNRYMPPIVNEAAPRIPFIFGYVWAGLMVLTGVATLVLAFRFDMRTYALFLGVFPIASKVTMVLIHYAVTRVLTRRRVRARRAASAQASLAA
jgi:hypothetical protein